DGVNVAARIEGLADPGGVCISRNVCDQVKKKLTNLGYEYIGAHDVKNISEPVRVYKVLVEPEYAGKIIGEEIPKPTWYRTTLAATAILAISFCVLMVWHFYTLRPSTESASIEKMTFPLPDRPSIAVLPFANMSNDTNQEYFSDGITEEIITGLSKIPRLFVIAGNSTFTYKKKPVKAQQVSEDLGVRYILEGSVRKVGDKVRVTAKLIDAIKCYNVWAERYDRDLKDIFALQDEITMKVMTALQIKLTEGEQAHSVVKGTKNIEAYVKFLQGVEVIKRFTPEANVLARQLAEEAIALDPEYPRGYRLLAATHWLDVMYGASKSPNVSLDQAVSLYQKVISMDPSDAVAYAFLGTVYTLKKQYEKAIALQKQAISINPNAADAHAFLGRTLIYTGRFEEAIDRLKKAFRLNPLPPTWYFHFLGHAYYLAGRYEEAIAEYKKALHRSPENLMANIGLTASYSSLNYEKKTQVAAAKVLKINPNFSLTDLGKRFPIKNPSDRDRFIVALRKAGLPESPPLPLPDKPSIAVLPFDNLSGNPNQEYLSDGISENIISALSKISKMLVIARNSTFTYKGKPVKVQKVSRELGVRYVLEGSVQKAGDRLRVTAQLVDAITGNHIWSERYDRELKDIFALQDDITKKIITAMQVELTEGEQARTVAKGTNNLEAYLKCLQANEYLNRSNIESNALAKQLADEAINLDPEYAWAYYIKAITHQSDVWFGTSKSPKQSWTKAKELFQKSIALDENFAEAYGWLGSLYSMASPREPDKAIPLGEKAVALNPNSAVCHYRLGKILTFAGRYEESIPEYKTAIRLNPMPPVSYFWSLGLSYGLIGQYQEAITWCEKAVRQEPDSFFTHLMMTVVYSWSGRDEDARAQATEVLRINSNFSLEKLEKRAGKSIIDALRKAGLK
ncbi:MAG: tetratricopeptide repeat protein, partial [Desulfobacterales bacterium]